MRPSGDMATTRLVRDAPQPDQRLSRGASHRTSVRSVLAVANVRPSRANVIVVIKLACSCSPSAIVPQRRSKSGVCLLRFGQQMLPSGQRRRSEFARKPREIRVDVRDGKSRLGTGCQTRFHLDARVTRNSVRRERHGAPRYQIRSSSLPKKRSACHVSVFQTR